MGIISYEVVSMDAKKINLIDLKHIKDAIVDCPDIVEKRIYIDNKHEAFFLFIEETLNHDVIQRDFMRPLSSMNLEQITNEINIYNLPCTEIALLRDTNTVLERVFAGECVFLCDKLPFAIACMLLNIEKRSIDEPVTEKNVRGAHDGFIEHLYTNLSILRRRVNSNKLKFRTITLGTQTKQMVVIAYIEGIANMDIVNGVFDKVSKINIDGLSNIGFIEQSIASNKNSIFPQFLSSERPDKAVAGLLEGRITILQDGTPRVLIAPVNFTAFFQAMDDFSAPWLQGSFLRIIRFLALIISLFLPALYIAIISFHYYAVPLSLLVPLAESRARVPFSPIMEAMILEFAVEMLREAAVRLLTYIGTAISVVAGLIIGQSAVEAGIVSNLLIIIVGATAVASYVLPSQDMAMTIRILRFIYMISASIFGIIGIVVPTALTIAHLIKIESLGQPYFQPFSPLDKNGLKDSIIRLPLNMLKKRPYMTRSKNKFRGGNNDGQE
jgi:spore germination protein